MNPLTKGIFYIIVWFVLEESSQGRVHSVAFTCQLLKYSAGHINTLLYKCSPGGPTLFILYISL